MFADSIRASILNRLHKQAGQKTAPDQRHCINFALATREPSTEDIYNKVHSFYHATFSDVFGCDPALCGKMSTHPTMKAARTADAIGRLSARPPWLTGLSRKSPTVAPSGRVRMKAAQNSVTRDTFVQ